MAGGNEDGDHVTVQERPRRLAVHQQDRRRVRRALVEVVDAQTTAVAIVDLDVLRLEAEIGESRKSLVRGAQRLHDFSSPFSPARMWQAL
jgi:hypothetical protein